MTTVLNYQARGISRGPLASHGSVDILDLAVRPRPAGRMCVSKSGCSLFAHGRAILSTAALRARHRRSASAHG
eukprot:5473995-Prymnesium_polylepis.1